MLCCFKTTVHPNSANSVEQLTEWGILTRLVLSKSLIFLEFLRFLLQITDLGANWKKTLKLEKKCEKRNTMIDRLTEDREVVLIFH